MTAIDERHGEGTTLLEPRPAAGRRPRRKAPARVRLPAMLDATAAAELQTQLRPLVEAGQRLVIEGEAVERASTAGIQLLLAADAALRAQGGQLVLADPAPALCEALGDLGLDAELQRWRTEQ
jgi:anti-anti-sigma regulatory factor